MCLGKRRWGQGRQVTGLSESGQKAGYLPMDGEVLRVLCRRTWLKEFSGLGRGKGICHRDLLWENMLRQSDGLQRHECLRY